MYERATRLQPSLAEAYRLLGTLLRNRDATLVGAEKVLRAHAAMASSTSRERRSSSAELMQASALLMRC